MSNEKPRRPYADIAPALGDYTHRVLFGDLWKRPGLSRGLRDNRRLRNEARVA
jgi:alkylhydroperoxidase/carboxymuconolactone decarboxylase family protein YurZ